MKQVNSENQALIFKDTYTPGKLCHFVLFSFDSINYGDNLDWVFGSQINHEQVISLKLDELKHDWLFHKNIL